MSVVVSNFDFIGSTFPEAERERSRTGVELGVVAVVGVDDLIKTGSRILFCKEVLE